MDAVRLKGTAGGGAPVVDQNGAPLGDQGLLKVVFPSGASGDPGVVLDALQRFPGDRPAFSQKPRPGRFWSGRQGGAQAAGGDDDIGPAPGQLPPPPGPAGGCPHHGVPKHVQTQGGQPLGRASGRRCWRCCPAAARCPPTGSRPYATQRPPFRGDAAGRPAACGKRTTERTACRGDGPPAGASGWNGPYRLTWSRSMPSTAAWTMASMSRACSAASHLRRAWGAGGVAGRKYVQQSS